MAPADLLEGSWPANLAQIAVSRHSEHMPLNRHVAVIGTGANRPHGPGRLDGAPGWRNRANSRPHGQTPDIGKRSALRPRATAPVLNPGRGKTKTGYLWAVLRDDRGWNGSAPPGEVFHYRPGRNGEYAAELYDFNDTIQVDAYGGYSHLATPKSSGGDALRLSWAHLWTPRLCKG
ncbi:hypothetical protein LPU83_pLPU83b_0133 (plasmid) [Rhizobium favelukesii]|uniref:Transposase IS66 central domain-containing protein n=1 Tax=Rhizobium favelukesii TaxID=348824 RepID=W6RH47_9HYPH|nr:hypothetical protein LPU83_pLPU83b_0133 [Rhizobium favelukesii]